MTEWLDQLEGYYGTTKTPQTRFDMLLDVFGSEPDVIMIPATRAYMMSNEWFPQVAQLRPYVDTERVKHNDGAKRSDWTFTEEQQTSMAIRNGWMRPLEEIQAEIDQARATLPATWAEGVTR